MLSLCCYGNTNSGKIASIYSTDAIFSCHVEKKNDICINADVLPKYPKIGITVGSLLNCKIILGLDLKSFAFRYNIYDIHVHGVQKTQSCLTMANHVVLLNLSNQLARHLAFSKSNWNKVFVR